MSTLKNMVRIKMNQFENTEAEVHRNALKALHKLIRDREKDLWKLNSNHSKQYRQRAQAFLDAIKQLLQGIINYRSLDTLVKINSAIEHHFNEGAESLIVEIRLRDVDSPNKTSSLIIK